MAKKEKDMVLDKKTREQFKQDIMEEINTKYKSDICNAIVDDVKESFDHDYKEDLKKQISDELIVDIKKDIAKEQKKVSRSKSFKIFRLYIYLLILIVAACYMIYCLYKSDNMDILKTRGETTTTSAPQTTKKLVKDFNWYYKEYGHLLNNLIITDYNLVNGNMVISSLGSEARLALAYKNVDKKDILVDGIINSVSEDVLKEAYRNLFGSEEGYVATNFNVDNLSYAYSTNNKAFIAIYRDVTETTPITNKITDIKEENGMIVITSIVGVIKDNKVYNINNLNEAVGDNADLNTYKDVLTTVEYRFKNINDNYYIDSIVKR